MKQTENKVEIESVESQVEASLVDVSSTGFFLSTLSMAVEHKEVAHESEH
ncbi:hypothetical protein [Planomicrobium sp. CPCC 101079]|nr:hypothetical protein [Planomicrobium sp. CPCC 101079]